MPLQAAPLPLTFGRYTLMRRIGAGGMGEVFLARENGSMPRACVVKKVLPDLAQNRAFVGRFIDESKVVVQLKHPNIAGVYAMGEVEGEYFLAMEYVQGKTVSRFTRRLRELKRDLPLGIILYIGELVCEGLAYAHTAVDEHGTPLNLVHRDLSPANVCISYKGDVKIIDFGAAQSRIKQEQTAPRVVIGNLTYMSPEQARKQPVDGRADVYSVGVLLWELLSLTLLPQKGDPVERWRRAANPKWEPPSLHNPAIPKDIDKVVLKALSKERDKRWSRAAEFGQRLRELREEYAPGTSANQLGWILSEAFPEEKHFEDAALHLTMQGVMLEGDDEATILVPPTALAFEHTILVAPLDWRADEVVTDRIAQPMFEDDDDSMMSDVRMGFGVPINKPVEEGGKSLLQEIEAMETGAFDTLQARQKKAQAASLDESQSSRRPTVPAVPHSMTYPVLSTMAAKSARKDSPPPTRPLTPLEISLVFIGATLMGFAALLAYNLFQSP